MKEIDLIDRQAAIDSCFKADDDGTAWSMDDIIYRLEQMPSEPELANNSPELANDFGELISRQAAIDAVNGIENLDAKAKGGIVLNIIGLPSAQPELIQCKDCIYYDKPHVENNGTRYEYADLPEDAFDELGTGLVNAEYGINIGGRCCRDFQKGYSEDKRIFVPEDNFCGRAERREDG